MQEFIIDITRYKKYVKRPIYTSGIKCSLTLFTDKHSLLPKLFFNVIIHSVLQHQTTHWMYQYQHDVSLTNNLDQWEIWWGLWCMKNRPIIMNQNRLFSIESICIYLYVFVCGKQGKHKWYRYRFNKCKQKGHMRSSFYPKFQNCTPKDIIIFSIV